MDSLQLSELAQKAKNGDMSAFEKLYIELSPEIYAIACEITQNKEESYDLVQDCFVAAMENISSLKEPDKIKNWLIRIAANKSRDYIKKKKPSVLTEDQYDIFENLEEEDMAVIPESSLETDERIEDVNEMLQTLTEDKRLCLLLRFKYDMSYAEIARELGITESAVKSRISRAKDDIEKEAEKRKKKGLPLFAVAPFGLVIFAFKKSADIAAASFAGSAAQSAAFAGITAAAQAGIAASATASTATTAVSASTATATTAAATGTGVAAKVAALSVAQKVIAGVSVAAVVTGSTAGVVTVVNNSNKKDDISTTAYTEEYTTAPSYEEDFILPIITDESETSENTSQSETDASSAKHTGGTTHSRQQSSAVQTEKNTTAKTSESTTKKATTTQKTTTTKATTTKKQTTTTTKASTTATEAQDTTKASTTTKAAAATTTTKAATTTTTEASSPATVTVTVWGEETSTTKTLYFEAGEAITATEIENRLSDEYGIEAIVDDINITAQVGGSYTATAYE